MTGKKYGAKGAGAEKALAKPDSVRYTYMTGGFYMATTEAQKRATRKYDEAHTRQIMLKLNTNTDADILEKLAQVKNRQGYIKSLIRADI